MYIAQDKAQEWIKNLMKEKEDRRQTPLHRARRLLALQRSYLEKDRARFEADKAQRLDRIAELSAEVRRLQAEENKRLDAIAREHLNGGA